MDGYQEVEFVCFNRVSEMHLRVAYNHDDLLEDQDAARPVCLIPLSRFLCLHSSALNHRCFLCLDVEHHHVY